MTCSLSTLAFLGLALIFARPAHCGVTIHYEGRAKNSASVARAISVATDEARRMGWLVQDGNAANVSITRYVGENDRPYKGPLRGIVIRPHPMCEPFHIQFGSDLFLQDYVKTQFAGPDTHIGIIAILRKIRSFFRRLSVEDEGDYWITGDRAALEQHMKATNDLISRLKMKNPKAQGPVRIPGDRLIDLIQ